MRQLKGSSHYVCVSVNRRVYVYVIDSRTMKPGKMKTIAAEDMAE
jgi:hypothetical protein